MRTSNIKNLCFALLSLVAQAAFSADVPPQTKTEVRALLQQLEQSDCEFNRNGTWYRPTEAAAHLQKKYQYMLDKGLVTTTESFIEQAASKSSMSGKPYRIRCTGVVEQDVGPWLKTGLEQYRAKQNKSKAAG